MSVSSYKVFFIVSSTHFGMELRYFLDSLFFGNNRLLFIYSFFLGKLKRRIDFLYILQAGLKSLFANGMLKRSKHLYYLSFVLVLAQLSNRLLL